LNFIKRHTMNVSKPLFLAAFALISLTLSAGAHAADLPAAVREALRQANIPLSSVGVVVREIHSSSPLIQVNAKQAMNPASTMKLLTTYAALELLARPIPGEPKRMWMASLQMACSMAI